MELSLYIPFVALIALVVFGVIWAISPKTAGKAAIKTVAFIAAVLLVAAMLAIPGIVRAEEITAISMDNVYVRVGVIEEVDKDNVAHIRDGAGVVWLWEKEEDDELEEGDLVGFLVQKTGNPDTITDDVILKVYYGGII